MTIKRTRIRNLENYIAAVPPGGSFRAIFELNGDEALALIGLSADVGNGESILPKIVGPISRYNADGRWIIRKDLPREKRYIRTVRWSWKTWSGEEHDEFRDIHRECYQRELDAPPAIELTYMTHESKRLIVSPAMNRTADQDATALHTINLFLELFQSCEIVSDDLRHFAPPALRQANWKLLPAGQYPWERIAAHVGHAVGRMSEAARSVILDRQKTLEALNPDECWVGEGGFDDYMAYVFNHDGLIVLESLRRDNAIYVFKGDWRPVSRLTKAQIIQADLYHARIVHSDGWKGRLAQIFTKRAA